MNISWLKHCASTVLGVFLFAGIALGQSSARDEKALQTIRQNSENFSKNLVAGDYLAVTQAYTDDAKIFPPNLNVLTGTDSILAYWTPKPSSTWRTVHHKVEPAEIKISGDTAYDWGYYEGSSLNEKGEKSDWKGKYVIIWKETSPGVWKIYLDCWNRAPLDK